MTSQDDLRLSRRNFIGAAGLSIAGGLAASQRVAEAATQSAAKPEAQAPSQQQGEYILRGGHVLPIDDKIGELPQGDVHIRDGKIVAVAPSIKASGAEEIDASNTIVMPGFVETHWHMWNSLWKGLVNDATEYFRMHAVIPTLTVDDHYKAVKLAALEALNAGVTTCHNWAHAVRNIDDMQAEMQALADVGIRARAGYPSVTSNAPTKIDDLRQALNWTRQNGGGRIDLGLILPETGEYFAEQVKAARELGLRPITDHGAFLKHPDLLGPEFIFTHGTDVTPEIIALLKQKGVKMAFCPGTDPMIGAGLPPVYAMIEGGIPFENMSFSVDVSNQSPVDPFASLRMMVNAARIQQANNTDLLAITKSPPKWAFDYQTAVRVGTLSGANVLGVSNLTGSLTPGKRADVIMVRTDDLNMAANKKANPNYLLIQNAGPANVDTVFVDGILRKRNGKLIGHDFRAFAAEIADAQVAMLARAGLAH